MHDLVNLSLNQSIIVRFSKFFFLLKACKNRQSLKTTGTCPGSPVRFGGPAMRIVTANKAGAKFAGR